MAITIKAGKKIGLSGQGAINLLRGTNLPGRTLFIDMHYDHSVNTVGLQVDYTSFKSIFSLINADLFASVYDTIIIHGIDMCSTELNSKRRGAMYKAMFDALGDTPCLIFIYEKPEEMLEKRLTTIIKAKN